MADTKMTKSAGEHWVCSVLSRQGWAAALTRDGLERTDILGVYTEGKVRHMIEVQVKSIRGGQWPLGLNSQKPSMSEHEWFVLVMLDPTAKTAAPRSFIVPRDHVAAGAWIQHMSWLHDPAAPPGTRNAGVEQARVGVETFLSYEDRWDLLGSRTSDVSVMLPRHYRKLEMDSKVGLPEGHPWRAALPAW